MTGDADNLGEEPEGQELPIDPSVTRELFMKWRSPRLGSSNPELMNNPVWDWLVRSKLNAFQATRHFHGPPALDAGPGWCFDRFGQSSTPLADGRIVLIAGEHEDHYDANFYIYNDVVVRHSDGHVDIFGYPRDVFPPTDFHSATLVGNRIVIIGSLGYPEHRQAGTTPVLVLDLGTFAISAVETRDATPGWIHRHEARLSADGASITVHRGVLHRGEPDKSLVENIDDWQLHLADWRWNKLTERRWQRWEVRRKDGKANHLWQFQLALFETQFPEIRQAGEKFTGLNRELQLPSLEEELGSTPDLALFERLYQPSLANEVLPKAEEEYGIHRIRIDGVIVRYVEDRHGIQITVEGDLPPQAIDSLTQDLRSKLAVLENSACDLVRL